jgi:hypothetical protein
MSTTVIVTWVIVSWIVGPTRGVIGGILGGFAGATVATGMARMAAGGELAVYYNPASLTRAAVILGIVAAVLALAVPYAARFAALGWAGGAILAAIAAPLPGPVRLLISCHSQRISWRPCLLFALPGGRPRRRSLAEGADRPRPSRSEVSDGSQIGA